MLELEEDSLEPDELDSSPLVELCSSELEDVGSLELSLALELSPLLVEALDEVVEEEFPPPVQAARAKVARAKNNGNFFFMFSFLEMGKLGNPVFKTIRKYQLGHPTFNHYFFMK